MNDHLRRATDRQSRRLAGSDPVEKHILLLKLSSALKDAPQFRDTPQQDPATPERQWLARVGALLGRLGIKQQVEFQTVMNLVFMYSHWQSSIQEIKGQVLDAIEVLRLELELDGRSEIGSAYSAGEVYKFFTDLKKIIAGAKTEVFIVDPYFNGDAFDAYLSTTPMGLSVRILADRFANDVGTYVKKHSEQYHSSIETRKSKSIHDRVVFIDETDCWIMGGSIKDAASKPTYLIPLASPIDQDKLAIYNDMWTNATPS